MLDILSDSDWLRIRSEYEEWWQGKREKPLLNLSFSDESRAPSRPDGIISGRIWDYPPEETIESIVDKFEYLMRARRYEYAGYPYTRLYFGPICAAQFIGMKPHPTADTVWFEAKEKLPPSLRHITLDREAEYFLMDSALRRCIQKKWGGGYVISNPECGGCNVDLLAALYGHEELSFMLYDEPDEAKRLISEINQAMTEATESAQGLTPGATGYTCWGGIFAPQPWEMTQCDYCAMIGPELFREFVLPDLTQAIAASPRYNYYHLDGPGEIIHLDDILRIPHLKCVQYVAAPNGDPSVDLGVYERVFRAKKNMWVTGPIELLEKIMDRNGTGKGIYYYGEFGMNEYDAVMKISERLMR